MEGFFKDIGERMVSSDRLIEEIKRMMDAMYAKYAQEHGSTPISVPVFSTARYQKELNKLERAYKEQFNTALNKIVNEKMTLTTKFFETKTNHKKKKNKNTNHNNKNKQKTKMAPM